MGDPNRMDIPAAEAAKAVVRVLPDPKNAGETITQPVKADEVLACAVHEDGVLVVVTTDGQKLTGKAPKVGK
jgi:hypothetical protein